MMKRNWIVLVGLGTLAWGCGGQSSGPTPKAATVAGVHTQQIQMQNVPDEIEAPGSVVAATTAQVAARTMGTVLTVAVLEGDRVKRGQLLAQLDERELLAQKSAAEAAVQASRAGVEQATKAVRAAEAQAEVQKKTYDRYVYLKEQKSVSPQEFDEVASRNQAAEARLAEARAALEQAEAGSAQAQSHEQAVASVASYARIVAPFDGRVLRRTVDPGSLASPGVPLFVVEDPSRYQLEVTLPADVLRKVHQGTTARVELDALRGRELRGTVAEMEAGANPVSHTARARLSLPEEPGVQSGLFGRAFFVQGEKRALVVPQSSLLVRGQLRGIYVVDRDGVAHWRVLTLGRTRDDQVEVLSGLDEGDVIVLNPETEDLDGRKISGVLDRSREARS